MPNLKAKTKYIDLGVAIGALLDMASDYADLDECKEETITMCARELRKLPTIDPESLRPKGEWIGSADGYADGELVYDMWECSECGYDADGADDKPEWNFCPNCGADMREVSKHDIHLR